MLGQNAEATSYLISAIDRDKSFDEAIMLLFRVYLDRNDKTQALNLYNNSINELEPQFQSKVNYDIAKFLWFRADYEQAEVYVDKITNPIYNVYPDELALLKESISLSVAQTQAEKDIEFETLPSKMNEFDLQYFPSLDANGQLVFTARDKQWGGDEQILVTRDSMGSWVQPRMISSDINSDRNEGTASISADGRTLVFTGCNRPNGYGSCDLYISYKNGKEWAEPEILPQTINTRFWESQPSLNSNGQSLYFVSTQPGKGGQDLWVSQKKNGQWSAARALNELNTAQDDSSPFIYPDDATLFFASNGRPGLGRFDLFKTVKKINDWSEPENLGTPINNELDQIGYCIGLDGWAYFSTTLSTGKIEMRRFKFPEELLPDVQLRSLVVLLVDAQDGQLLDGKLNVLFSESELVMNNYGLGYYTELIKSDPIELYASAPGYFDQQVNYTSDSMMIQLQPFELGSVLGGPFHFGSNSHEIKDKDIQQIKKLAEILKGHPELVVTIEGYTDVIGNVEDNMTLSRQRVNAVVEEMEKLEVSSTQIHRQFFGESRSEDKPKVEDDSLSERKVIIRLTSLQKE